MGYSSKGKNSRIPSHLEDPYIKNGKEKFFTDVSPWISFLKDKDFTLGTRIHGNVFSLLAGTPAFVIAHDSRTLELAEYNCIPYIKSNEIKQNTTITELYENADYTKLNSTYKHNFDKYKLFLRKNGLKNIYEDKKGVAIFNKKINNTNLQDPIESITNTKNLAQRLISLHEQYTGKILNFSNRIKNWRTKWIGYQLRQVPKMISKFLIWYINIRHVF